MSMKGLKLWFDTHQRFMNQGILNSGRKDFTPRQHAKMLQQNLAPLMCESPKHKVLVCVTKEGYPLSPQ
jgi:hypothetical protein